jgi:hypothetical protein
MTGVDSQVFPKKKENFKINIQTSKCLLIPIGKFSSAEAMRLGLRAKLLSFAIVACARPAFVRKER